MEEEVVEDLDDYAMLLDMGDAIHPFDLDLTGLPTNNAVPQNNFNVGGYPFESTNDVHQPIEQTFDTQPNDLTTQNFDIVHNQPVIGAGPLPHSYGMQAALGTGSTLSEFTRRRNWSQRILDELKDFLYILSPDGRFVYASPSVKYLTGYQVDEIVGTLVSDYIHPDDANIFVREFNESIATGNPLRFFYRFRKKNDKFIILEAHGHPHLASDAASFVPSSPASFCRGFFMMARPYPTRNAAMLDSFLEHKIESERLKKRIAQLKREEQADQSYQPNSLFRNQDAHSTATSDNAQSRNGLGDRSAHPELPNPDDYNGMPPPAKPTISNIALTRQNLDEALAASRPDSINDKMARYEGANHLETIEMLTGLQYQDGERSKGISTGASSPKLIRGDAGIAILVDKSGRPANGNRTFVEALSAWERKRRPRVADEYVCTDCGTLDSPEWRKGPSGPKSLCNACGLRWAKKEKKKPSTEINDNGAALPSKDMPTSNQSSSVLQASHSPPLPPPG